MFSIFVNGVEYSVVYRSKRKFLSDIYMRDVKNRFPNDVVTCEPLYQNF